MSEDNVIRQGTKLYNPNDYEVVLRSDTAALKAAVRDLTFAVHKFIEVAPDHDWMELEMMLDQHAAAILAAGEGQW